MSKKNPLHLASGERVHSLGQFVAASLSGRILASGELAP